MDGIHVDHLTAATSGKLELEFQVKAGYLGCAGFIFWSF